MGLADGEGLAATMSVQMKVNLGNYESADAFLSVSGITMDTTEAEVEVEELLAGPGRIVYDRLRAHLAERVAALRATKK